MDRGLFHVHQFARAGAAGGTPLAHRPTEGRLSTVFSPERAQRAPASYFCGILHLAKRIGNNLATRVSIITHRLWRSESCAVSRLVCTVAAAVALSRSFRPARGRRVGVGEAGSVGEFGGFLTTRCGARPGHHAGDGPATPRRPGCCASPPFNPADTHGEEANRRDRVRRRVSWGLTVQHWRAPGSPRR